MMTLPTSARRQEEDADLVAALPRVGECLTTAIERMRARIMSRSGSDVRLRVSDVRIATCEELLETPEVLDAALWAPCGYEGATGFCAIEAQLLDQLVGWLFGDAGAVGRPAGARRAPTSVEIGVGDRLCDELYRGIERHWPTAPAPTFERRPATASRHCVAEIPRTAAMMAATVTFGSEASPVGCLTVALPVQVLRGVSPSPAAVQRRVQPARTADYERLMGVEMEVVVELTRIRTPLRALEALEVGQELPLGLLRDARALVNGRASFIGEAGETAGHRSFRIRQRSPVPNA